MGICNTRTVGNSGVLQYFPSISFFFIFINMDEFMQEFEDFVTQTQRDSSFRDNISKFGYIFLQEFNKL